MTKPKNIFAFACILLEPVLEKSRKNFTGIYRQVVLGGVLLFLIQPLYSQDSLVGGTLSENTTWTNDYTYIVYKDLRIPKGITLKIEPGVTVKINQGRGIYVLEGNLAVSGKSGEGIDSIFFVANYTDRSQLWKWKGISFTGSGDGKLNYFEYVNIIDAEIAIDIFDSDSIRVENCSLLNNQNIGVRIFNSIQSKVINCHLLNNYDGIEMVASDENEISGSLVQHCILKNINHNIYLLNAFGGIFLNNVIENNLIEGGNNGVWADNGGGISLGKNVIRKNIFIKVGLLAGYGLLIAEDSIEVTNNIFWQNRIAIYFDPNTYGSTVSNNSFYQNRECFIVSSGSVNHLFDNNTFSLNSLSVFKAIESSGLKFEKSNIFNYMGKKNIVLNESRTNLEFRPNFWNTSDETQIDEMIWDEQDDPELGIVNFTPYLYNADTVCPVSPPAFVIKQLVDEGVKLTWQQNPENDLSAYKVNYGAFNNYTFTQSIEIGKDTVFYLPAVSISDSIAVSALDNESNASEAQLLGHESAYAFAVVHPYAGPDNFMCQNLDGFHIEGSTIPYSYQSLAWTSKGDGFFNNPGILLPVYFPGPVDLQTGKVWLTLTVYNNGQALSDSLILTFIHEPQAYAGKDTTIFADSDLELGSAQALNENALYWASTGDGNFSNDTILNPVYTPGPVDTNVGVVKLILVATSECGVTSDTLTLFIIPYFKIEGNLWYENQKFGQGVILAIKSGEEGARETDMVQAEANGFFRFERLIPGRYYLYAVPDTLFSDGAVPAYYANKINWQEAYQFTLNADTYDVDILLPTLDYQLPEGQGSISGYFELPALTTFNQEIYCNSWFDPQSPLEFCDGGLSNVTVFLFNSSGDMLLDYTLTDENGNFFFKHLPYGSYLLGAEKAGYQTLPSPLITLSPAESNITDVVLKPGTGKIGIFRDNAHLLNLRAEVYPNPAANLLHVPLDDSPSAQLISIYNLTGIMVIENSFESPLAEIEVSLLTKGLYFGKINCENYNSYFIFVKN